MVLVGPFLCPSCLQSLGDMNKYGSAVSYCVSSKKSRLHYTQEVHVLNLMYLHSQVILVSLYYGVYIKYTYSTNLETTIRYTFNLTATKLFL